MPGVAGYAQEELSDPAARFAAAVDALTAGRPAVLWGGEAEGGDVVVAAPHAGPEAIAAMAVHARGLIRLALTPERCDELGLALLPVTGGRALGYTVSVEARRGVATGISAADRARTIAVAIAPGARPGDLVRPGHMFPVRTAAGGTGERCGRPEAAVDLARAATGVPAAAFCHILDDAGREPGPTELRRFALRQGMPMVSADDVRRGLAEAELEMALCSETSFDTAHGRFRAVVFRKSGAGAGHVALVRGDVGDGRAALVRLHGECVLGDVFHSIGCGSPGRLEHGLAQVAEAGCGVLLYLAREGRGLDEWDAGPKAPPTAEVLGAAELEAAALILRRLGVTSVRLLADDPGHAAALAAHGVHVLGRSAAEPSSSAA
jgi:3,4-dihydroxy 2-butanone 4-phosphate synthase/GTP cyclohydrolase II